MLLNATSYINILCSIAFPAKANRIRRKARRLLSDIARNPYQIRLLFQETNNRVQFPEDEFEVCFDEYSDMVFAVDIRKSTFTPVCTAPEECENFCKWAGETYMCDKHMKEYLERSGKLPKSRELSL